MSLHPHTSVVWQESSECGLLDGAESKKLMLAHTHTHIHTQIRLFTTLHYHTSVVWQESSQCGLFDGAESKGVFFDKINAHVDVAQEVSAVSMW